MIGTAVERRTLLGTVGGHMSTALWLPGEQSSDEVVVVQAVGRSDSK